MHACDAFSEEFATVKTQIAEKQIRRQSMLLLRTKNDQSA